MVGAVGAVEVVVALPLVWVVVELVEIVDPPYCPVLKVPTVWPVPGVK
jgi:hypothetical protein